ncbi:unnamed protein product [Lupinus luteus]|uniref:C2H2-type domain-containing protein n=1 Tax=Lupinus luteus TaxID=3873 RepID=A0AAV1WA09_LUPLU
MRAHGIGDELENMDEDEDDREVDWEERLGGSVPPNNKRVYALRANLSMLKSCRIYESCGKRIFVMEIFSYTSKDGESQVSSPTSEDDDDDNDGNDIGRRESWPSASKDGERRNPINFIAPLSCRVNHVDKKTKAVAKGLFECKACKKVFNSHQELGGHRASHKKVVLLQELIIFMII